MMQFPPLCGHGRSLPPQYSNAACTGPLTLTDRFTEPAPIVWSPAPASARVSPWPWTSSATDRAVAWAPAAINKRTAKAIPSLPNFRDLMKLLLGGWLTGARRRGSGRCGSASPEGEERESFQKPQIERMNDSFRALRQPGGLGGEIPGFAAPPPGGCAFS